jgi:hypothetical protein
MSSKHHVLSVGYRVTITPDIKKIIISHIQKYKPEAYTTLYQVDTNDEIYAGLFYDQSCRGGHHKSTIKNQIELRDWFNKQTSTNKIYINRFYAMKHIICASATINGKPIFIILYNTGTTTTLHKHNCVNGYYGKEITLETTISIDAVPYID